MAAEQERIKSLEDQVTLLHNALEQRGVNTRGTTDIFGRKFNLPVDAEHKATVFNGSTLMTQANPHMRGFWSSTFGFFSTFFSTFAAAPLMAYIKKPDVLNLDKADITNSAIASVAGTIAMRVMTGWLCEKFGARKAFAFLLLLACPGCIGMFFVNNAPGFIFCRFIIGLGLATFVTCQVWNSQLFNKSIVGAANATAGGWGNLGGGITNLLMPFIMLGMLNATDDDENAAWRLCYIVPLGMHLLAAGYVMTGRDLPDGNFSELESSGAKQKSDSMVTVKTGASNINAWILTLTYGFCFGVELTMTNVAALYFYTDHGLTPQMAGICGSIFGLMNLFARSLGGMLSDAANAKYGMRGRLWAMWIVQVFEGMFCIILGVMTLDKEAPDTSIKVNATFYIEQDGEPFTPPGSSLHYSLCEGHKDYTVASCGSIDAKASKISQICQHFTDASDVVYPIVTLSEGAYDLPARFIIGDETNMNCIRNSDSLTSVIFIMIMFSICVQMAEGLHYGVVPFISRPALGIVSGMVGAGGNAGAVISLWAIFKNKGVARTDEGFVVLGATVIVTSLLMHAVYFPKEGGMLFKAGGSYDPQRWKPPADYRGADVMDYDNVKVDKDKVADV